MRPDERIRTAIRTAVTDGRVALVPFITAGYPDKAAFVDTLAAVAECADVVEIGVPFSDPMADGMTIQRASTQAIADGVSLRWILAELGNVSGRVATPPVLMSYLNPLLAFGLDELAGAAAAAGVAGFIVPDLPYEESAGFREAMDAEHLALIQLVTPATPDERLERLCGASRGFVYAVTVRGITGGDALPADIAAYLARVKAAAGELPVCAGFGIREARQVREIRAHADGVVVGSALIEVLERGEDPRAFLRGLVD